MEKRKKLINGIFAQMEVFRRHLIPSKLPFVQDEVPTPAQSKVLFWIVEEGIDSVKDIANALNITSSAATQLIEGLVNYGLIERCEDINDRRKFILKPTSKAIKISKMIHKKHLEFFCALTESLSDTELENLISIHDKMINALNKMTKNKTIKK